MKLLIFGGSGLVGSALRRVLGELGHEIVAPARVEYDILKGPPPRDLFDGVFAAINAAIVKPPAANDVAARVNVEFPKELASLCASAGIRLVHISTDGVFSGAAGPYDEKAVPDPDDDYGRQKLAGEPEGCLILRTSVIGPEERGFNSLLCWLLAQDGAVFGYANHMWNGVTSLALARAIGRVLEGKNTPSGVRHIYADDVSKLELLSCVANVFARDMTIRPASAPVARDRRLRTLYPEFLAACALPPLDVQLAELPLVTNARGGWKARP